MFTYFIQRASGGPIKIGRTKQLKARLSALESAIGEPIVLLAKFDGDHEAKLHAALARHRRHGEWFHPVPEVFAAMRVA